MWNMRTNEFKNSEKKELSIDLCEVTVLLFVNSAMFKFQRQRCEARKRFLNRFDIISFNTVPDHIVDGFYGSCNYKNRLIVLTFGFLNGLHIEQLFELIQWKDVTRSDQNKMIALYNDFEKPRYKTNYYSYNVHHKLVMYLNGDIRKFGVRIEKSNNRCNN